MLGLGCSMEHVLARAVFSLVFSQGRTFPLDSQSEVNHVHEPPFYQPGNYFIVSGMLTLF